MPTLLEDPDEEKLVVLEKNELELRVKFWKKFSLEFSNFQECDARRKTMKF